MIVAVSVDDVFSNIPVAPEVLPVIVAPVVYDWAVKIFKWVYITISNKYCLYTASVNDELENIFAVAVPELYSKPLVFALPIDLFPEPVPIVNDPLLDVATSVMANVSKGVTPVAFAISGEL